MGIYILVMADDYVYIVVVNNIRECQNMMVYVKVVHHQKMFIQFAAAAVNICVI